MEEGFLGTAFLDNHRAIHIAELSRESIINSGAEHLGFGGYFLFETSEARFPQGIKVLARLASLEAAFSLLDVWRGVRA